MSSLTNINNNSSVVNVGRTTPISPGAQPPEKSIPVVVSNTAELAIPVIEQQKIQSEVALSLLGIPRSEVALGIFSDVNTYDVNPNEWSKSPEEYTPGYGVKHLPNEAGALVQAPPNKYSVLSSKRFFRYQPGRVSSATFGVKCTTSITPIAGQYDLNPSIRKYGIFDNYDGYYWEVRGDGNGDNFVVVRRTQSLLYNNPVEFSNTTNNNVDYRIVGKPPRDPAPASNAEPLAIEVISDKRFKLADDAFAIASGVTPPPAGGITLVVDPALNSLTDAEKEKCKRDMDFAISAYLKDLQYNTTCFTQVHISTLRTAQLNNSAGEKAVHNWLGYLLKEAVDPAPAANAELRTKIDTLVEYVVDAVDNSATGALAEANFKNINYGDLNPLEVIFEVYKKYIGYLVSSSFSHPNYTDEIKYKCYRDIGYIIDGYKRDLVGGGNAGTVYNAQNFFFNDILRVTTGYDEFNDVITFHENAHTLVKAIIGKDGLVNQTDDQPDGGWNIGGPLIQGENAAGFVPVLDLFGLRNQYIDRFNPLSDIIIENFSVPYTGTMDFGDSPQFGDAFTLRDGLIHIHAGLYDPSLLKTKKKLRAKVNVKDGNNLNSLTISETEFVVDQSIYWYGDVDGLGAVDPVTASLALEDDGTPVGKLWNVMTVSGVRNNIITLYDPLVFASASAAKTALAAASGDVSAVEGIPEFDQPLDYLDGSYFIEPNVPFIFPKDYFDGTNEIGGESTATTWKKPDGMFPYMYTNSTGIEKDANGNTRDEGLPADGDTSTVYKLGYINTAIDTTGPGLALLKAQIDEMNYRYNNWVKQNIDPKYYAVYEYRVPRSRFSHDKLDGEQRNQVYSDVATGEAQGISGVTVRPGQAVVNDDEPQTLTSLWDIDFKNVSMLKCEFSWYGAVGALFLAYVPVGNGEARWVRVHHLRASNQLKISSLGNATLPITYNVYGGGDTNKLGIENIDESPYSGPLSDYIIKYGASYYIDGGDRGTVRLYSHTNLQQTQIYGNQWVIPDSPPVTKGEDAIGPYFLIPTLTGPTDRTYFMKSEVTTNSSLDQGVTVQWIDGNKIYTSAPLVGDAEITMITKRPSVVFGLKAKENIFNSEGIGIRNRVQVYPTKLSAGNFNSTPVKLVIQKTPIFQTSFAVTGDLTLEENFEVTPAITALPVPDDTAYLANDGEYVYGWFRANVGTVFGRLSRQGGQYFFTLLEVYSVPVILRLGIPFLKDGLFDFQSENWGTVNPSFRDTEKERLSSVRISQSFTSPIPNTGTDITSFFVNPGSEQFDLLSYFDYNKDYLSYPLTDQIESIFVTGVLTNESTSSPSNVNISMTWEEQ